MTVRPVSILIADDDMDDQFFLKEALRHTKVAHSCVSVYNGIELMDYLLKRGAYKDVEEQLPDMIMLDLNMPLLDGLGALMQIRAHEALKLLPVFILSTSRSDYDREKSIELGANEFYTKPYNYYKLKDIVEDVFAKVLKLTTGIK